MDLAKQYQKKTDKQHILDNPDTYIGSVEEVSENIWLLNENKITNKSMSLVPGLYKLFDEGIVNCRDHVVRMEQKKSVNVENILPVTHIDVSISDEGTVTMLNDGNGIDIAKHPEYDIWIPEMIFGHLRTSTNYNKDEKKIVGGKNGFGFKLVLIWSKGGSIETVDHVRKLKYSQTFDDNLSKIGKPSIRKYSGKPYTKIIFTPDYARLGVEGLSNDMRSMFYRRVYDIAAVTSKSVKVKLNGNLLPVKGFQNYIDMYLKEDSKKVYEESNSRWEYAVSLTPHEEFTQVSFVNGIYTSKGGKHVEYVLNQITRKLVAYIEKKKKVSVNATSIKEQLMLFVRCDIENPAFDSQTKDYMNTPMTKFGSSCVVSDKFIEKLAKMGVMDAACALTQIKENKNIKKSDGSKSKNIRGIHKLVDANWAGTSKSNDCTLILCEGDSAKAGIISGLSSEDRNIIGVYPMKGKILNVRGETSKKIMENKEIVEIKRIMGLETGKVYDENNSKLLLRYGRILFMTDQDLDGSHIKGLGLNLFQSEWSGLSKISGFIGYMNTPILKARKGSDTVLFYNEGEYNAWKETNDVSRWNVKYYKGLGTSTGKEFKEYFENKKIVVFDYEGVQSDDAVDKVFNKKRADDRKEWLAMYNRESYVDTGKDAVSFQEFIDKEMIHFSKYDCDRSIPNIMDGLKISLRKILYSAFKKNLMNEIKVAQFSGYVSEHSGYHHGEASLNAAIVGMAQNYVGSNNINLFEPNGQFGTRLQGGKDSASERYIFTQLNSITRKLFSSQDDNILNYLDDDGQSVEPIYYAPVIPVVLVNGVKGIGTGFSTEIQSYNPSEIIHYIRAKLHGEVYNGDFHPYYECFKGTVTLVQDAKYMIKGVYEDQDVDTIHITELPIGVWTDDYKQYLESLMENTDKNGKKITPLVKEYDDMSKSTNVDIYVTFTKGSKSKLMGGKGDFGCNLLEKQLKLYTTVSTTNMHLFDHEEKLRKYESVKGIIDAYFDVRLGLYSERKQYLIDVLSRELNIISNKHRYIQEVLGDTIDLRRKTKDQIESLLVSKKYDKIDGDYKYLVKMPMDSVSEENVEKLLGDMTRKQKQLDEIKTTSIENMWLHDLGELEDEYTKYKDVRKNLHETTEVKKIKRKKK
jgi:DNA topoisomerase-2